MKTFDELKQNWKSQQNDAEIDVHQLKEKVMKRLVSDQKKLILSNLFVSVSFAIVFVVMAWVWSSNPDRTIYFYASLISMSILLAGTLAGLWAGVQYKNEHTYKGTLEFLQANIQKLTIRKFMLQKFMPVYMILLLVCFYFYYADTFKDAEPVSTFTAYALTTLFFAGVYYFSRGKRVRQIEQVEKLQIELEKIRDELEV
ncbi:hypothetical protein [Rhodohalobacter halophilus]|uniref:hypothetical protein n=1 Tax=Rhodohalobacter halophilus TaxID=1812810 RepID=UPI00083FC0E5|nr:hypothetical protein [Rhodohalobacter halophilus]